MAQGNDNHGVPLALELPPDLLETIALRAAELLAERVKDVPEYLTTSEAAEYIRASRQRVFDLSSQGRLKVCKDGSRNLYRRVDLDSYLSVSGEASP